MFLSILGVDIGDLSSQLSGLIYLEDSSLICYGISTMKIRKSIDFYLLLVSFIASVLSFQFKLLNISDIFNLLTTETRTVRKITKKKGIKFVNEWSFLQVALFHFNLAVRIIPNQRVFNSISPQLLRLKLARTIFYILLNRCKNDLDIDGKENCNEENKLLINQTCEKLCSDFLQPWGNRISKVLNVPARSLAFLKKFFFLHNFNK